MHHFLDKSPLIICPADSDPNRYLSAVANPLARSEDDDLSGSLIARSATDLTGIVASDPAVSCCSTLRWAGSIPRGHGAVERIACPKVPYRPVSYAGDQWTPSTSKVLFER